LTGFATLPQPSRIQSFEEWAVRHLSAGVNIETNRYYERIGLMPTPPRTDGRRRIFDAGHLRRLVFIRRGRELGFSIDEIRDLLGLARGQGLTCAKVKTMTEMHIAGIRSKVKDLRKLERVLNDLAARCHGRITLRWGSVVLARS